MDQRSAGIYMHNTGSPLRRNARVLHTSPAASVPEGMCRDYKYRGKPVEPPSAKVTLVSVVSALTILASHDHRYLIWTERP